jgi:iron-sulfur cluster assembly protein
MITLTPAAVNELKEILAKEERQDLGLRVFVSPGGCSGMSYGMTLEDHEEEGDLVIEQDGVRLFIDEFSINYLTGSEIDYVDSLIGGGFAVRNPNAVRTCGCGHSFDTGHEGQYARSCH